MDPTTKGYKTNIKIRNSAVSHYIFTYFVTVENNFNCCDYLIYVNIFSLTMDLWNLMEKLINGVLWYKSESSDLIIIYN